MFAMISRFLDNKLNTYTISVYLENLCKNYFYMQLKNWWGQTLRRLGISCFFKFFCGEYKNNLKTIYIMNISYFYKLFYTFTQMFVS